MKIGSRTVRVDPCMVPVVKELNKQGVETFACCCGHGLYPMSIIIDNKKSRSPHDYKDLISGVGVPRSRRFYVRDNDGVFHIPEAI